MPEVDKLGYALTVPQPLTPIALPDVTARMERYEVAGFIRDARSVTSDAQVEHQMLNAFLAHARGAADRFLDEYYHSDDFSHNPFKIAEKQTVSVQIDSILRSRGLRYALADRCRLSRATQHPCPGKTVLTARSAHLPGGKSETCVRFQNGNEFAG